MQLFSLLRACRFRWNSIFLVTCCLDCGDNTLTFFFKNWDKCVFCTVPRILLWILSRSTSSLLTPPSYRNAGWSEIRAAESFRWCFSRQWPEWPPDGAAAARRGGSAKSKPHTKRTKPWTQDWGHWVPQKSKCYVSNRHLIGNQI
jgi:hypothetical protein